MFDSLIVTHWKKKGRGVLLMYQMAPGGHQSKWWNKKNYSREYQVNLRNTSSSGEKNFCKMFGSNSG